MYAALMEDCLAWERVHDPEAMGRLTAEQYLDALLAAGYPEDVAQKAATQRARVRMRAGLPP